MDNFAFINDTREEEEEENGDNFTSSVPLDLTEDDYYGYLNLSRDATPEEITNQYRKLSRIYHPDKHQDAENKTKAETLFSKTKVAYEVLMDPQRRAIYDTLGVNGLEPGDTVTDLVPRYRTPAEIREEFEMKQREKEERRIERKTNPKGQMTVNINASELFTPYEGSEDDEEYLYDSSPYVELTGFHFSQSIESPLTSRDTLTMAGAVSAENGRGKGNINFGWRKFINNRAWGEAEVGGSTNGVDFALKGYSALGNKGYTNFFANCQSTPDGIRPGLVVGTSFDQKSQGSLTWRTGSASGLQTQYIWDNSPNRFVASFHLGIPHSYAGFSATRKIIDKEIRLRSSVRGGTFGLIAEYGIDKKISNITTLSATVCAGFPIGVSLRIKVTRANQIYLFPIQLSDQVLPAPIVYGTLTPLILWVVVSKLFIEPYEREKQASEKAKLKAQYQTRMAEKKAQAEAAVQLMRVTCARIVADEEAKQGLIIDSAKYGRLVMNAGDATPSENTARTSSSTTSIPSDEIIDVTIPLQCLIRESKLILHNSSKSQIPGFYDPAPGEDKHLVIHYTFKNRAHEIVIQDEEPLRIPKESHRM